MQSRRGKGAFILTRGAPGWKKHCFSQETLEKPEGQGLWNVGTKSSYVKKLEFGPSTSDFRPRTEAPRVVPGLDARLRRPRDSRRDPSASLRASCQRYASAGNGERL